MALFNLFKKKGITIDSANFARLVKQYCADSGIPVASQIKITKAISKDFIDDPKRSINDFFLMDDDYAKQYLTYNGLSALDADIFWSIMKMNSASFFKS